jgi:hypothetical protein
MTLGGRTGWPRRQASLPRNVHSAQRSPGTLPGRTHARTQRGRDTFRESFQDVVDPEHELDPVERAKAGENAYREHMARLAFNSAKARRTKKTS